MIPEDFYGASMSKEEVAKFLLDVLGERFVRYVFAVEDELDCVTVLSSSREAQAICRLIYMSPTGVLHLKAHGVSALTHIFSQYIGETQINYANSIRINHGGEIPEITCPGDSFLEDFGRYFAEIYPLLLLPTSNNDGTLFFKSAGLMGIQTPFLAKAKKSLLQDEFLQALFPGYEITPKKEEETQFEEKRSLIITNSGGQLDKSPGGILCSLAFSVFMRSVIKGSYSLKTCLKEAINAVSELRELAKGNTIDVPICYELYGACITDGEVRKTDGASCRAVNNNDLELLLLSGGNNEIGGRILLELKYPLRILKVSVPPSEFSDDFYKEFFSDITFTDDHQNVEQGVSKLQMSFLLAENNPEKVVLSKTAAYLCDPLNCGNLLIFDDSQFIGNSITPREKNLEITSTLIEDAAKFLSIISECGKDLSIVISRTLSGMNRKTSIEDAYIDLLIAFESLFGGGSSELSFRISSSVAILLGSDLEERIEIQKLIGRAYGKRSNIVHVNKSIDSVLLQEDFLKIKGLLLKCLRTLMLMYPKLLKEKPERRSKQIILGLNEG